MMLVTDRTNEHVSFECWLCPHFFCHRNSKDAHCGDFQKLGKTDAFVNCDLLNSDNKSCFILCRWLFDDVDVDNWLYTASFSLESCKVYGRKIPL